MIVLGILVKKQLFFHPKNMVTKFCYFILFYFYFTYIYKRNSKSSYDFICLCYITLFFTSKIP